MSTVYLYSVKNRLLSRRAGSINKSVYELPAFYRLFCLYLYQQKPTPPNFAPKIPTDPDRPGPTPTDPEKFDFFVFFQKGIRGIVKGIRGIVKGSRGIAFARDKPGASQARAKADLGLCLVNQKHMRGIVKGNRGIVNVMRGIAIVKGCDPLTFSYCYMLSGIAY